MIAVPGTTPNTLLEESTQEIYSIHVYGCGDRMRTEITVGLSVFIYKIRQKKMPFWFYFDFY